MTTVTAPFIDHIITDLTISRGARSYRFWSVVHTQTQTKLTQFLTLTAILNLNLNLTNPNAKPGACYQPYANGRLIADPGDGGPLPELSTGSERQQL